MKLSAVVLTKNEEKSIERCIKSLLFCDEIIIIDDYSEDNTLEKIQNLKSQIPNKFKILIFKRKLNKDFAGQRNFGLSKTSNEWVLFVDADEEVSDDLQKEIRRNFQFSILNFQAYYIKRRDYFWGKEIRHGELRQIRLNGLIRLIRKDFGRWLGNVHEVFHTAKNVGRLKGFLNHYPHSTLKEFIKDINFYSTLRAEELYNQGKSVNVIEIMFVPSLKFIYNYFINFGFLDGPAGFTYAFLMSFHSFLVRAKLYMLKSSMPKKTSSLL